MGSVFKKFTAQDKAIIPFNAHKQYQFNSASAGINYISKTELASTDADTLTVSGRRFTIKNKIQADLIKSIYKEKIRKEDEFLH